MGFDNEDNGQLSTFSLVLVAFDAFFLLDVLTTIGKVKSVMARCYTAISDSKHTIKLISKFENLTKDKPLHPETNEPQLPLDQVLESILLLWPMDVAETRRKQRRKSAIQIQKRARGIIYRRRMFVLVQNRWDSSELDTMSRLFEQQADKHMNFQAFRNLIQGAVPDFPKGDYLELYNSALDSSVRTGESSMGDGDTITPHGLIDAIRKDGRFKFMNNSYHRLDASITRIQSQNSIFGDRWLTAVQDESIEDGSSVADESSDEEDEEDDEN